MENRSERPSKLELKVYLTKLAKQSLENDISCIKISNQAMRRWVKREFMTEEEEKLLKKVSDLKSTRINISKD